MIVDVSTALTYLRGQIAHRTQSWLNDCEMLQREAWNQPDDAEGTYPTAMEHYLDVPTQYRHPFSQAQAGHLLFLRTHSAAGHIMTCSRPGWCITNDVEGPGGVFEVPISEVISRWSALPLAATDPYWHGQVRVIGEDDMANPTDYTPADWQALRTNLFTGPVKVGLPSALTMILNGQTAQTKAIIGAIPGIPADSLAAVVAAIDAIPAATVTALGDALTT